MARRRGAEVQQEVLADGSIAFWANLTVAVNDRRRVALGHSRDHVDRGAARVELERQEALVKLGLWVDPREQTVAAPPEGWVPTAPPPSAAIAIAGRPAGSMVLFADFVTELPKFWDREISEKGAEYNKWGLGHLLPFFGEHPLVAIDLDLLEAYKRHKLAERDAILSRREAGERFYADGRRLDVLSRGSINKTIEVLSTILKRAKKRKLISENAAADEDAKLRVKKPQAKWLMPDEALDLIDAAERIDRTHRPLTRERVARMKQLVRTRGMAIIEAAADIGVSASTGTYYLGVEPPAVEPSVRRAIVATLVCAGLRADELCRLCWRHIDFDNRRVEVPGTKTRAAERYVKIVDFLLEELWRWRCDAASCDPSALVFPTATGSQRHHNGLNKQVVKSALKEANRLRRLEGRKPIDEGITTHSLRHTFASLMLAYPRPLKTVQRQLGHEQGRTTTEIYEHTVDTDYTPTKRTLELLMHYAPERMDEPVRARHTDSIDRVPPRPAAASTVTITFHTELDRVRPKPVRREGRSTTFVLTH